MIVPENTPDKVELTNGEKAVMCPVIKEEHKVKTKIESMSFKTAKEKKRKEERTKRTNI